MLVEMRRVDIVVPRVDAPAALRTIHRAGLLHLAPFGSPDATAPGVFGAGAGTAAIETYRNPLQAVVALQALLPETAAPPLLTRALWDGGDAELLARVEELGPVARQAERASADVARLAGELDRLEAYQHMARGLTGVVGRLPQITGYAATGVIVGARHRPVVGLIRDELEAITEGCCEVISGEIGTDRIAALLLYPTRHAAEVESLLGGRDLERVVLPPELTGIPLDQLGTHVAARAEQEHQRLLRARQQLAELGATHGGTLAALRMVLEDRLAEARALMAAGASDHLVVLSGWVPASAEAALRAALQRDMGSRAQVLDRNQVERRPHDAPVALANGPLRPFEPLALFAATPRYGSVDPTAVLAITFPAFVGLMIGDAGYGLVLLALLGAARVRFGGSRRMRLIWPVGVAMSVSTILFGILFGEVFGSTGHDLFGLTPLWMDRREAIVPLLELAITIGVAQVALGLGFGVVNASRLHDRRETAGRAALLLGLLASVVVVLAAARVLPVEAAVAGLGALAVAVVMATLTLGLIGPVELLGLLGNVLSYARLMAIGLAGVMLAVVAKEMGALAPNIVVGILIAVLVHGLNLVMGVFDASVQGLRLHYVEFFTRFIEPGGTPYAPFSAAVNAFAGSAATVGGR